MDKLKIAWKTVGQAARDKRSKGEIPTFLGAKGMLALMYDRIVAYNKDNNDHSGYLLDLAISALFAFADSLPDIDTEDFEDSYEEFGGDANTGIREHESEEETSEAGTDVEDEDAVDPNDPRWTSIPPGKGIRDV